MNYIGDFAEDATVNFYFTTNDSNGAAVAPSSAFEAADLAIYKDNSATQKATANGVTMTSPFDSVTGLHLVTVDTSNDTGDAGFWATGSDYTIVLTPDETVDSQTVVSVLGQFSIENRTTFPKADFPSNFAAANLTASGNIGIDWANVENATTAVDLSGTDIQLVDTATTVTNQVTADVTAVSGDTTAADNLELDYDGTGYAKANSTIGTTTTNTDMRGTDNAALASVLGALTDAAAAGDPTTADTVMQYVKQLINVLIGTAGIGTFPAEAAPGNAVSLAEVIRAIHTDVTGLNGDAMRGTDSAALATALATAQTDLDTLTGTDGATLATSQPNYAPATAASLATAQADLDIITGADGVNLLSATQASIDAIEADTNELQTDDVPGLIAALNDISAADVNTQVDAAFTTQMADSVSTDGTIATREQALYMILQTLTEFAISGTTLTVKKVDGSTSLMTFTLDDGTTPTSLTRAS